jgi:asparagine synthase (glutamine-hydrolysing)
MCGIVGAYGEPGNRHDWLETGCARLHHRGPDDHGVWRDPAAGFGFGQTRLAIQDLSAAGRQPMVSPCGRYRLIFNGEIYNHPQLRAQLSPRHWAGHADTETLLACFVEWGVERTLRAAVGMFALALFDGHARTLVLARDRFGEKPLYYGYAANSFVFASELKGLRPAGGFDHTLDRRALAVYMRHGCVPAPHSIYAALCKLPTGCWLELAPAQLAARARPEPRAYWSALAAADAAAASPLELGDLEATDELERILGEAVRGQLISDVPLGAFLSGGIDSSTIVALMQAHSSQRVRTFSIGFEDAGYDESRHAGAVAAHLGTEHTGLTLRAADALALVPRMPATYDEPFADPSQLPTLLVAQLARRHVTVALSGDAGDEVFGGYNRYFLGARLWRHLQRMPRFLRRGLAGSLRAVSPAVWDRSAGRVQALLPAHYRMRTPGDKLHKIAGALEARDGDELYARLVSQWWDEPLVTGVAPGAMASNSLLVSPRLGLLQRMMLTDTVTYLPDDILVKVDRAAMAVSLETRVPLLDHRVFEFAWRLPMRMKVRDGQGKWLLRQLLHRYVPAQLVERPKMGFAVPLDPWLRGPLRAWAEELLSEHRLRAEGFLDAAVVGRRWREHLSGRRNWQYQLWNVLMFQAWLEAEPCAN